VGSARESPGPTREPALSTRTSRALVAGAAVLSVTLPAAIAAEAAPSSTSPPVSSSSPAFLVSGPPAPAFAAVFGPVAAAPETVRSEVGERPASRSSAARARKARPAVRPAKRKPARVVSRVASRSALAERTERTAVRPASRSAARKTVHRVKARPVVRKVARKAPAARRGMGAVVAFARANVGRAYGGSWDCSGFVQRAYRAAGISLPRQSGAQAARARTISWAAARPGDLIVGRGHVGIYMGKRGGRHMMIDSGNPRVGVTYRAVYFNSQGLHPERVG
jgi:cell wall-associated NlpC family hydrolase